MTDGNRRRRLALVQLSLKRMGIVIISQDFTISTCTIDDLLSRIAGNGNRKSGQRCRQPAKESARSS